MKSFHVQSFRLRLPSPVGLGPARISKAEILPGPSDVYQVRVPLRVTGAAYDLVFDDTGWISRADRALHAFANGCGLVPPELDEFQRRDEDGRVVLGWNLSEVTEHTAQLSLDLRPADHAWIRDLTSHALIKLSRQPGITVHRDPRHSHRRLA